MNIEQIPLMSYLKANHSIYYGKALELREDIEGWLSYIPHSFPHYTRHTVRHSDEILNQISNLLFVDSSPPSPTIPLSAVETYILIAAAYLHDAGMVASDREKVDILRSDRWRSWTQEEGGAARWHEIEKFRHGDKPRDENLRNFLADVQVRFLISEFIRREHHLRSAEVISQHHGQLGRFAFDNPILQRTISDICIAHGLKSYELDDSERFPFQRDVRDEKVNVRLLAILLRLGDLLDMSSDRACPLLLNAACPLPTESLAHWTQYQRITHRNTSPARIDITAECHNGEEHRVLQDWCQWIVDETKNASILMAHSPRHPQWEAPAASISGEAPTIIIRPHESANYIPSRWVFTLDQDAILTRLINDVYDSPSVFVRELAQNSLDATRCQMYVDLAKEGVVASELPTQIENERRSQYPINISLRETHWTNPLSGEVENRHVFSIEDPGIGMDSEIIEKYLLQIGRSFYSTDDFRRSFKFAPSSRFGIGFLSVFGVSEDVTIETYKPSSRNNDGPIKLVLRGPRSYLLTENGIRTRNGTQISVVLNSRWAPGYLTQLCSYWFRMVEVPIVVDDFGSSTTILGEPSNQFTQKVPDLTDPKASLEIKGFPISRHGIEGTIYVFVRHDSTGERWDQRQWAQTEYLDKVPSASMLNLPDDLICMNGITLQEHIWRRPSGLFRMTHPFISVRADYRGPNINVPLSRNHLRTPTKGFVRHSEIESRCGEIISEHLTTSPHTQSTAAWKYKQRLMHELEVGLDEYWYSLPGAVRAYLQGSEKFVSMKEISSHKGIRTLSNYNQPPVSSKDRSISSNDLSSVEHSELCAWTDILTITEQDIGFLSERHEKNLFESRAPKSVRMLDKGFLAIDWVQTSEKPKISVSTSYPTYLVPLLDKTKIGANVIQPCTKLLLNSENEFVAWLIRITHAVDTNQHGLSRKLYQRLLDRLSDPLRFDGRKVEDLSRHLEAWRQLPSLPEELRVPTLNLTVEQFQILDSGENSRLSIATPRRLSVYKVLTPKDDQ